MAVKTNTNVVGVKSSSLALFEGVFAGVIGLGIAILWSLRTTFAFTAATESVLSGLVFGLTTGALAILVLPLIYFAFGWVIGYVHGFVFNVVAEAAGGIMFRTEQNNKKD